MVREKKMVDKSGLPPGTVIYTGDKDIDEDIIIESICFNENNFQRSLLSSIREIETFPKMTNWINLDGIHKIEHIHDIGKIFGIDNFILEDIVNVKQRAKIEDRGEYVYIVLKMIRYIDDEKRIDTEQLSIIVSNNYLLTLQENKGDVFDPIRERIENSIGKIRSKSHDFLAYTILDIIVDNYLVAIESVEDEIDKMEGKIINSANKKDLEKILQMKQEFSILKRSMIPTREIMNKLVHSKEFGVFKDDMKVYFTDVYDHTLIVYELVENMSNRVTSLIELYHSTINSVINDTMKVLTIITTVFIPLSFLTGVYGMNFRYMPYLDSPQGYYWLIFIMFLIVIGMIYFFKRKKWL